MSHRREACFLLTVLHFYLFSLIWSFKGPLQNLTYKHEISFTTGLLISLFIIQTLQDLKNLHLAVINFLLLLSFFLASLFRRCSLTSQQHDEFSQSFCSFEFLWVILSSAKGHRGLQRKGDHLVLGMLVATVFLCCLRIRNSLLDVQYWANHLKFKTLTTLWVEVTFECFKRLPHLTLIATSFCLDHYQSHFCIAFKLGHVFIFIFIYLYFIMLLTLIIH